MDVRKNSDVLRQELDLSGKKVLDVGSGEGHLSRMMAREGADVIGLECSERQLAKARRVASVGSEIFIEGVGQQLPFEASVFDYVVFFNSLHHIPVQVQYEALSEAARVLKPGGTVYVSEPVAQGAHFELLKPIDDETMLRKAAYDTVCRAGEVGLKMVRELTYNHPVRRTSYEELREKLIGPNPEREKIFKTKDFELRESFVRLSKKGNDGCFYFDQPTRVNILVKN